MRILKKLYFKLLEKLGLQSTFSYRFLDDVPKKIYPKVIYIIGHKTNPWLLLFFCPCGCEQKIQLNLLEESSPCWRYSLYKKQITIRPSIWRDIGCKSHFIIKNGNVQWV